MRKHPLVENEYYHIYNRGVDKRNIFTNDHDYKRFFKIMQEFNCEDPIGSLYEKYLREKNAKMEIESPPIVEIVAYCLNPNHFHFILKQIGEKGIEKFMQKIGIGYSMYFNKKYSRSGSLFQGKFKSSHIESTGQLLRLSVYVNCNSEIHKIHSAKNYPWCSFSEYISKDTGGICKKEIITNQFRSEEDYNTYTSENIIDFQREKENEELILE
jgi:putative transposase